MRVRKADLQNVPLILIRQEIGTSESNVVRVVCVIDVDMITISVELDRNQTVAVGQVCLTRMHLLFKFFAPMFESLHCSLSISVRTQLRLPGAIVVDSLRPFWMLRSRTAFFLAFLSFFAEACFSRRYERSLRGRFLIRESSSQSNATILAFPNLRAVLTGKKVLSDITNHLCLASNRLSLLRLG